MDLSSFSYQVLEKVRLFSAGTPVGVTVRRVAESLREDTLRVSQALTSLRVRGYLLREGTRGWRLSGKAHKVLED